MAKAQEKQDHLRINEGEDADRPVVLHPKDDDLFVRTGKQVINACRLDISVELWMQEFHSVLESVKQWSEEHNGLVSACHCAPQGSRVVFFFSPMAGEFDFALADQLAELNVYLQQSFNIGTVEAHQIPWGESSRFLHPESSRWIYGRRIKRTSESMEA